MHNWHNALAIFSDRAPEDVEWMVVGSAATRLHGACVEPNDVDILVHPDTFDDTLFRLADAFSDHAADGPALQDLGRFMSTQNQPLLGDGGWLFGRWIIDGCKLEIARIREPVGPSDLLETHGLAVWGVRRVIQWRARSLPVVPLEVQFATILCRAQFDRERSVRKVLTARGYDHELLEQAMVARGLAIPPWV